MRFAVHGLWGLSIVALVGVVDGLHWHTYCYGKSWESRELLWESSMSARVGWIVFGNGWALRRTLAQLWAVV